MRYKTCNKNEDIKTWSLVNILEVTQIESGGLSDKIQFVLLYNHSLKTFPLYLATYYLIDTWKNHGMMLNVWLLEIYKFQKG